MVIHHLTDRDLETRTAVCSVCGPVGVIKAGNGWTCATRHGRAARRRARLVPRSRSTGRSPHHLTDHDPESRTGTCPVCGPVSIVPWGRGWACAQRATELGRVRQQEAPQEWCQDCRAADGTLVWLPTEGPCPRCGAGSDLARGLRELEDARKAMEGLPPGFHLTGGDPYEMPEYESVVPGWKTIG